MPGCLRSVGNQPEPKLIALSCRLNAARVSSSAPSRSGAGGDSAGSVCAYGSIASCVDLDVARGGRHARRARADVVREAHALPTITAATVLAGR